MARTVMDIFLSSTSEDLRPCRDRVRQMIDRMGQVSIAMESFGAKPTTPLATCRAKVESADALIVLVGHRYGWMPSKKDGGDGQRSITTREVFSNADTLGGLVATSLHEWILLHALRTAGTAIPRDGDETRSCAVRIRNSRPNRSRRC